MSYSVKTEQGTRFFKTHNEAREYVRGILEQTDGGECDIICPHGRIAEFVKKITDPDGSSHIRYEYTIPGFNSSTIRCCTLVFDHSHKYLFSDAEVNSDFKCGRYVLKGKLGEFGWFNSIENARIIAGELVQELVERPYDGLFPIFDKATDDLVEHCGFVEGVPMSVVGDTGYWCTSIGTLARGKMYRVAFKTDRPNSVEYGGH